MGSVAYGVSSDTSDMDVYGVCMPPKDMVFPHLAGEIFGFGTQIKRFETWQEHHIQRRQAVGLPDLRHRQFFQLAMENNPNIIDSLFTPRRCVLSSTAIGEYIREHRVDFLHKGAWHKFKGYAYSQLNKIKTKTADGQARRAGRGARLRREVRLPRGAAAARGRADPGGARHRPRTRPRAAQGDPPRRVDAAAARTVGAGQGEGARGAVPRQQRAVRAPTRRRSSATSCTAWRCTTATCRRPWSSPTRR